MLNYVSNSSTEIAEGNQDLSQRTQEQSSSLEEISATIEEINSSIREVADISEVVRKFKLSKQDEKGKIKAGSSVNNKSSKPKKDEKTVSAQPNEKTDPDQSIDDLEKSMDQDFDEGDFEKF